MDHKEQLELMHYNDRMRENKVQLKSYIGKAGRRNARKYSTDCSHAYVVMYRKELAWRNTVGLCAYDVPDFRRIGSGQPACCNNRIPTQAAACVSYCGSAQSDYCDSIHKYSYSGISDVGCAVLLSDTRNL